MTKTPTEQIFELFKTPCPRVIAGRYQLPSQVRTGRVWFRDHLTQTQIQETLREGGFALVQGGLVRPVGTYYSANADANKTAQVVWDIWELVSRKVPELKPPNMDRPTLSPKGSRTERLTTETGRVSVAVPRKHSLAELQRTFRPARNVGYSDEYLGLSELPTTKLGQLEYSVLKGQLNRSEDDNKALKLELELTLELNKKRLAEIDYLETHIMVLKLEAAPSGVARLKPTNNKVVIHCQSDEETP